jgi:serine phosphatase RsbU (regulator of sigma subunit)
MSRSASASARQAAPWDIQVRHPDGATVSMAMDRSPLTIGRSRHAHIRLPDERVSRTHAQIVRDREGRWWLRDLHSRNGVKLNGTHVMEHRLRPGDQIEIGRFLISILPTAADARRQNALVYADDDSRVSRAHDPSAARVSLEHLKAIRLLEQQLAAAGDIDERAGALCWFMIGQPFHGLGAAVLRLVEHERSVTPKLVSDPITDPKRMKKFPSISRSLLKAVYKQRAIMVASSDEKAERMVELTHSGHDTHAAIAAPIHSDPEALWVLYLVVPQQYSSPEWVALVSLAAQQFQSVESFMASARSAEQQAAVEQDLHRAREIQLRLVSDGSQVESVDAAVSFETCRTVGGDYADVLSLPDGRVAPVIADVCGKGLPAALVTATLHSMLHTLLSRGGDIRSALNDINAYLISHVGHQRFVTLCLVVIDPATGRLDLINAGHPAPIIIRPDASFHPLPHGDYFPLGIEPQDMQPQSFTLHPRELLMLFTDGLEEMLNASGTPLTSAGLARAVAHRYQANPDLPMRDLSGEIQDFLRDYQSDGEQLDDRTFILLRRK